VFRNRGAKGDDGTKTIAMWKAWRNNYGKSLLHHLRFTESCVIVANYDRTDLWRKLKWQVDILALEQLYLPDSISFGQIAHAKG
jgi:DNA-binding transcriptional regulator/RsmH inhibitor MraZ